MQYKRFLRSVSSPYIGGCHFKEGASSNNIYYKSKKGTILPLIAHPSKREIKFLPFNPVPNLFKIPNWR
jgi:hypothetical protein